VSRGSRTSRGAGTGKAARRRGSKASSAARASRPRDAAAPARRLGRRVARGLVRLALLAAIWCTVAAVLLLGWQATRLPDISRLDDHDRRGGIRMIALDGTDFAQYGDVHDTPVAAGRLPGAVVDALLAIEDRRFRSHFGVDPLGVLRAAYVNLREGAVRQGASTLTQQLAKNLFLTPDRTFERKIREVLLALWLEATYSKEQLLTIYLNRMYFGAGAWGLGAAARTYFGKSATELTVYEAAMLAGLVKAPSRYNPVVNPQAARDRATVVLSAMVDAGVLSRSDADAALARGTTIRGTAAASRNHRYFADWVLGQARGYRGPVDADTEVHTTLDRRLQRLAEAVMADALADQPAGRQAALVAMDRTGAVRAMVGGRDYRTSQFNRAVQAMRQPGSVFKPVVYLAALDAGARPDSTVSDDRLVVGGWSPRNFDGRYHGTVTLTEALAHSYNAATVRLARRVGIDRVVRLARRLGVTAPLAEGPSLALGAAEVTLLEMTAVYAAFANGGTPVRAHGIGAIRLRSGYRARSGDDTLYRHRAERRPAVAGSRALADLDVMLREAVRSGTGRKAAVRADAAGKTGTSQNHRDAWFIGYAGSGSDRLVIGTWVGHDSGSPMKSVTGGGLPARIWARFVAGALE